MKMTNLFLLLLIASLSFSCSSKKKSTEDTQEIAQDGAEEVSDDLLDEELADDDLGGGDDDLLLDDEGSEEIALADSDEEILLDDGDDELLLDDTGSTDIVDASPTDDTIEIADTASSSPVSIDTTSDMKQYVVQKGDTYMKIAWKIYGDYTKWRTIANLNGGGSGLSSGSTIKYYAPASEFNWSPNGDPYLIILGDTLGKISGKVYGTQRKWRKIYDNNRPLIRDPNLIFAGFTLYYVPEAGSVALNQ